MNKEKYLILNCIFAFSSCSGIQKSMNCKEYIIEEKVSKNNMTYSFCDQNATTKNENKNVFYIRNIEECKYNVQNQDPVYLCNNVSEYKILLDMARKIHHSNSTYANKTEDIVNDILSNIKIIDKMCNKCNEKVIRKNCLYIAIYKNIPNKKNIDNYDFVCKFCTNSSEMYMLPFFMFQRLEEDFFHKDLINISKEDSMLWTQAMMLIYAYVSNRLNIISKSIKENLEYLRQRNQEEVIEQNIKTLKINEIFCTFNIPHSENLLEKYFYKLDLIVFFFKELDSQKLRNLTYLLLVYGDYLIEGLNKYCISIYGKKKGFDICEEDFMRDFVYQHCIKLEDKFINENSVLTKLKSQNSKFKNNYFVPILDALIDFNFSIANLELLVEYCADNSVAQHQLLTIIKILKNLFFEREINEQLELVNAFSNNKLISEHIGLLLTVFDICKNNSIEISYNTILLLLSSNSKFLVHIIKATLQKLLTSDEATNNKFYAKNFLSICIPYLASLDDDFLFLFGEISDLYKLDSTTITFFKEQDQSQLLKVLKTEKSLLERPLYSIKKFFSPDYVERNRNSILKKTELCITNSSTQCEKEKSEVSIQVNNEDDKNNSEIKSTISNACSKRRHKIFNPTEESINPIKCSKDEIIKKERYDNNNRDEKNYTTPTKPNKTEIISLSPRSKSKKFVPKDNFSDSESSDDNKTVKKNKDTNNNTMSSGYKPYSYCKSTDTDFRNSSILKIDITNVVSTTNNLSIYVPVPSTAKHEDIIKIYNFIELEDNKILKNLLVSIYDKSKRLQFTIFDNLLKFVKKECNSFDLYNILDLACTSDKQKRYLTEYINLYNNNHDE